MDVHDVNMISVTNAVYVDSAMDMYKRLKQAREDAGFKSARGAAKKLGIKPSTYAAHENGQNDYDAEQAASYAKAFNVTASWLLFGEDEPNDSKAKEANALPLDVKDEELFREAYRRAREIEGQLLGGRGPRLEFAKMVSIIYDEMLSEK